MTAASVAQNAASPTGATRNTPRVEVVTHTAITVTVAVSMARVVQWQRQWGRAAETAPPLSPPRVRPWSLANGQWPAG